MTNFTPSPENYTIQNISAAASHFVQLEKFFDKLVQTLWYDWGRIMEEFYADEIEDPDDTTFDFIEFESFHECILSHSVSVSGYNTFIELQIIDSNGGFQLLSKQIDDDLLKLFHEKAKLEQN